MDKIEETLSSQFEQWRGWIAGRERWWQAGGDKKLPPLAIRATERMVAEREAAGGDKKSPPLAIRAMDSEGEWQAERGVVMAEREMVVAERKAAGGNKIPPLLAIRATDRVGGRQRVG